MLNKEQISIGYRNKSLFFICLIVSVNLFILIDSSNYLIKILLFIIPFLALLIDFKTYDFKKQKLKITTPFNLFLNSKSKEIEYAKFSRIEIILGGSRHSTYKLFFYEILNSDKFKKHIVYDLNIYEIKYIYKLIMNNNNVQIFPKGDLDLLKEILD